MNVSLVTAALRQLDHPDEARSALDEAKQLIIRLQADETKDEHHDLRFAEILFREAEAKLNGKTDSK